MEAVTAKKPKKSTNIIGAAIFFIPTIAVFIYCSYHGIHFWYMYSAFAWLMFGRYWETAIAPQEDYEYLYIKNGNLFVKPEGWFNKLSIDISKIDLIVIAKLGFGYGTNFVNLNIYSKSEKNHSFPVPENLAASIETYLRENGLSVKNYVKNT